MDWIVTSPKAILFALLSTLGIYVVLIFLTRLFGVRSFSKMSGFDFAITVAIGSVIAGTVMAETPPLAQSAFALACLFGLQMSVAFIRARFEGVQSVVDNAPRLIMVRRTILHDQLKAAKMTESDLWSKLREANVLQLDQIKAVIAESTGDVSVLHHDGGSTELSPQLLDGIKGRERYLELIALAKQTAN